MNNCVEYFELISAYADGELTESDKKRLEDHMSACESCSALLELYREISVAAGESQVPAPESLCSNVMEKILSEDASRTDGAAKKRKLMRVIMSRYVPIAACLAIVLLTLPRIFDLNRPGFKNDAAGGSGAAGKMETQISSSDDALYASGGGMSGTEPGGGMADMAGSGSSGPQSGSENAPAAPPPSASTPAAMPAPSPSSAYSDTSRTGEDNDSAPVPEESSEAENEAAEEAPPAPEETRPVETETPDSPEAWPTPLPAEPPADISMGEAGAGQDPDDAALIFTAPMYAIIEIRGGLTEAIEMYGLEPMDDVPMYFEIPRDIAEQVIAYINSIGYEGVTITIVNEDGEYAAIFYTPAG